MTSSPLQTSCFIPSLISLSFFSNENRVKSAKTYHNRAIASIYCENTSHYFRAQRPVKFCQRTVAMCICVCVCEREGGCRFTARVKRPQSLISPYTHRERAFLPCDSFNRPRLYEPREGHPWVKGQTNFLSDLQAEQGWWQCSKNVQHKFSRATRPCSLQRPKGPGQRV